MKTLLIISGGIEAVPGIQTARAMGLHVIVSDGNPNAPGFEFAHERFIVSTYDINATVQAAEDYCRNYGSINGVLCMAADVPLTVAHVALSLDLPGISIESAQLAVNKLAMKRCFVASGIPTPWFSPVESLDHLFLIVKERGYDLVLKPVDSRGARGVLRLSEAIDLDWAYWHALFFSPSSQVMVEEFLSGPQISTESVFYNGKAVTIGFSDRNYEYINRFKPYIIENGGDQPSFLSNEQQNAICHWAEEAGFSIGIHNGIVKGDMVWTNEGPKVIEVAPRLSGGWFSSDQIPLATGIDLNKVAIRIAMGEELYMNDLKQMHHRGVAIRYFFPDPGKVIAVRNIREAKNMIGVHKLKLFITVGGLVETPSDHTKRAGFVITVGETKEYAVERAKEVVKTVEIETSVEE